VKTPALLFLTVLLAASVAHAQESYGTIRVTTKMLEGGFKSTTILDPEKHTAEETLVDAGGKTVKKITYLLGDRDLSIAAIFADGKGNVTYKASYQRDAAGRVTESSFTSPDGRYLGKRIFTYGVGDKVIEMKDFDAQGRLISPAPTASGKPAKKRR
jgi:hypothetical protein